MRIRRLPRLAAIAALAMAGITAPAAPAHSAVTAPVEGFVTAENGEFRLGDRPFRYGGTNNYYMIFGSRAMVDDVFADALAMDLTVLRAWAALDIGSLDGTVGHVDGEGHKANVYFQYWDPAKGAPAHNDGADGLQRLDRVLAKANELGIRLILPLVNNWKEFGGMDQYVTWAGGRYHDEFYTDPRIKQWYKDWASHLLNRTNTITGVQYKNDPAIFSWELANEPRCINANLPASGNCTTRTLVDWADEMSRHIKSIDGDHMVSVGDEGFLNRGDGSDWLYNGADGVDHEALTRLPAIDFGTYHLYPTHWGRDNDWGTRWIRDHQAAAESYGKPVILEEFGITDQSARDAVYKTWTSTVRTGTGDGWNFWILTGVGWDGTSPYPDYDGFRVMTPGATATMLAEEARLIAGDDPDPDPGDPTAPCAATHRVVNAWSGGFQGEVTIECSRAVAGWRGGLTWPAGSGVRLSGGWSAVLTTSGDTWTFANASWNGAVPAGGRTTFGFVATRSGDGAPPAPVISPVTAS